MVRRRCYRRAVRWATLVSLMLVACSDLREFHGAWSGRQVGESSEVRVGVAADGGAILAIDEVDERHLAARLTIAGLLLETPIASIRGAEADVLAGITFSGAPLRVFLAFAPVADGRGDALVIVALYDDHRVEVRLLRGGTEATQLYAIFALREAAATAAGRSRAGP